LSCSIVIRAFNEERHIGRLLEGILRQSVPAPEIVVVDSGSTDSTVEIVSRFPARVVAIEPAEFSFGRSLNRGIAATSRPLVVLASAHVYPEYDDWLERLLEPFADPTVALAYGRQCGDERTKFSERQIFRQWFPAQGQPVQDHPFCNNANSALRRESWTRSPFDESLTGLEDIAWARAAIARGERIAYVPEAVIVHVHEETPARIFRRYQREAMALRRIDPQTHFDWRDFVRLYASSVWHDLAAARREGVLARHAAGIVLFRLLQYWGTYRGFARQSPASNILKQRFYYPGGSTGDSAAARPEARRIEYAEAVKGKRRG
jgi:rhamnosyltransferase